MPTDRRQALGRCVSLSATSAAFEGTYQAWQTGGAGAGRIAASATASPVWPPASITSVPEGIVTALPQYMSTGTLSTLPLPSFTASVMARVGNVWFLQHSALKRSDYRRTHLWQPSTERLHRRRGRVGAGWNGAHRLGAIERAAASASNACISAL